MAKLTHEDILAYLEEATILELNDLVSAIEEKFGVTAAAPVAAAPAAEAAEAAGPSEVTVTLTDVVDAKGLVDKTPSVIKENIKPEEAEEIKKKLMDAGATVEIK